MQALPLQLRIFAAAKFIGTFLRCYMSKDIRKLTSWRVYNEKH